MKSNQSENEILIGSIKIGNKMKSSRIYNSEKNFQQHLDLAFSEESNNLHNTRMSFQLDIGFSNSNRFETPEKRQVEKLTFSFIIHSSNRTSYLFVCCLATRIHYL